MVDRTRLELALPTTPRNAQSLDKDALLQNCYIDTSKSGVSMAVKRPGFFVGSEGITTGTNRGIFVNPQNQASGDDAIVWYINGSGVLSSVNVPPVPPDPEEETLIIEGNITPLFADPSYILYINDSSLIGPGIVLDSDGVNWFLYWGIYTEPTPLSIFYQQEITLGNTYFCKMTKTATEFICYFEGNEVARAAYQVTNYNIGGSANATDVAYGPAEG